MADDIVELIEEDHLAVDAVGQVQIRVCQGLAVLNIEAHLLAMKPDTTNLDGGTIQALLLSLIIGAF